MHRFLSITFIVTFATCLSSQTIKKIGAPEQVRKVVKPEFQFLLDSTNLDGAILVFSSVDSIYYSNDFKWSNLGHLPASTFKIPNSIVALETKVVQSDTAIFKWDGQKRFYKAWEQDLSFVDAFRLSCVPCYQEVARAVGVKSMNQYVDTLGFGNMIVDSSNIDSFWLTGKSKITQFQQIDFLIRLNNSLHPISRRTENMVKSMMINDSTSNYILRGKTGWSTNLNVNNGWFVGCVETSQGVFYFATNIEPRSNFNMDDFSKIRKEVTMKALRILKII